MSNSNGTCTHIKVTGVRCGSPALRGKQFCHFHQNAHRGVRRPKQSRLHPIALIEDEESIQYALMEVINALMRNTIDLKRATLILRALHIPVKNAGRVKCGIMGKNAVTNIPEYAPPSVATDFDDLSQIDLPYNAFVPPKTERQIMEEKHRAHKLQEWRDQQAQIRANLERARITIPEPAQSPSNTATGTDHVATAAKPQPSASVGADASSAPRPQRSEGACQQLKPTQAPGPPLQLFKVTTSNSRVRQRTPTRVPRHASRPNPQPPFSRRKRTQLTPQRLVAPSSIHELSTKNAKEGGIREKRENVSKPGTAHSSQNRA